MLPTIEAKDTCLSLSLSLSSGAEILISHTIYNTTGMEGQKII